MAIWYQPPQPFIGGFQPLDPRKYLQTAAPVDTPHATRDQENLNLIISLWPREAWSAQHSPPLQEQRPVDVPHITRDQENFGAVLTWARENWPAQRSGIIAPTIPPRVDLPPTQRFVPNLLSILSWPREDWRPQRSGITIQSGGASPVTLSTTGFQNLRPFSSIKDALTAQYLGQIRTVVNNIMRGKINATLNLSLNPLTTTTTINDPRIGGSTYISLEPLTPNAAAELATGGLWVSAQGNQFVTFTHSNSFTTDRSYVAILLG